MRPFLWTAPPPSQPPNRYGSNWGQSDKNRQKTALFSLGTTTFDSFTSQNETLTIRKVSHKSDGQAFRLWNPQSVVNGGVFSCARHTRAFPANSTFLLSQPSQKLLQRGYFSLEESRQKRWTSDTGSLMILKVVQKSHVINWHTATCSVFCEGCEREKTKIPVTRAREEVSKRGDFRFLYTSPNTNPSTQLFTSPSVREEVAHNKKITLEISPKTLDFFPKNSHVFWFFSYVFPLLSEKNKKDRHVF